MQRFAWLKAFSKPYFISGKNVEVIYSPEKFYGELENGIENAKNRIVLSSLYLGTGSLEMRLVDRLKSAIGDAHRRPDLRTTVLLDHLRGFRGTPNSYTLIRGLIGQRFQAYFYHTPNLRGLLKRIAPPRFNEVMGLQHMKIYLFDDSFIISGANLSNDYFTNRQDRYIKFSNCPQLADFMTELVQTVSAFSFQVNSGGTIVPPTAGRNPLTSRKAAKAFRSTFRNALMPLVNSTAIKDNVSSPTLDTVVYPLLQMGLYSIHQDARVTQQLLAELDKDEKLYLTSGYFNLPPQYVQAIQYSKGYCAVLGASPQANGFYGAQGVARHVPSMYTQFAQEFLETINRHHCQQRVKYCEYFRTGWTFHGKGIWYYLSNEQLPSLTLVGSSNYGHRSLTRDLEVQVAMVTENLPLRHALHKEKEAIFMYGKEVDLKDSQTDPERQLNSLQRIATRILRPHV